MQLIMSDAHAGLAHARRRHFVGVAWQRCQLHFLMNALEKTPQALEDALHRRLRGIWDESADGAQARGALQALVRDLEDKHPELALWLESEGEDTLACFGVPSAHRKRLRTTNGNERVNQDLLPRSRGVRIFPNPESCLRLATALLKEWHEDWITGRRYLRMEPLLAREEPERIAA